MHGGAEIEEVHPRTETAHWAAAAAGGCLIVGLVSKDPSYLFLGAMCLTLLLQCAQKIEIDGRFVKRVGLHPVTLDIATAEVVRTGTSWWRELFFLGGALQLQDADGNRLYLEAWLWEPATRSRFVEAVSRSTPS